MKKYRVWLQMLLISMQITACSVFLADPRPSPLTIPSQDAPPDHPDYSDPILSPTISPKSPEKDEIINIDCSDDSQVCVLDTEIGSIDGAAYIGVKIAIDQGRLKDFMGKGETLGLDAKIDVSTESEHVGDIEVKNHAIAAASPDAGLVLTSPSGDPLVNVITTVNGHLFYCNRNLFPRCPQQSPFFSFDLATGNIIILSRERIPVGEVDYNFPQIPPGVFGEDLDDSWPWWVWFYGFNADDDWPNWDEDYWPPDWDWGFSADDIGDSSFIFSDRERNPVVTLAPRNGVLFVFEPNGSLFASIGPGNNDSNQPVLNFVDSDGNPGASLSVREGGVFIDMGLGGEPVAIVTPNNEKVEKGEESGAFILTTYIPVTGWIPNDVNLTGTLEIYVKVDTGQRKVVSRIPMDIKIDDFTKFIAGEPGKSPTATPEKALFEPTSVPNIPKVKTDPTPGKTG